MKIKLIQMSFNPPYILERGADISSAKPLHGFGELPNGASLQKKVKEIDDQIKTIVSQMHTAVNT